VIPDAQGLQQTPGTRRKETRIRKKERTKKNLSRPQVRVGGRLAHINKGGRIGVERGGGGGEGGKRIHFLLFCAVSFFCEPERKTKEKKKDHQTSQTPSASWIATQETYSTRRQEKPPVKDPREKWKKKNPHGVHKRNRQHRAKKLPPSSMLFVLTGSGIVGLASGLKEYISSFFPSKM
jgi:hypothetical protein